MVVRRLLTVLVLCGVVWGGWAIAAQKPNVEEAVDRKTAADGLTSGWLVESPWPDQSDKSQAWRRIALTLVVVRDGKVVRKIGSSQTFRGWNFWAAGRQVVYEEGPTHGPTRYVRVDVATGKELERWSGNIDRKDAPAWAKASDSR